MAWRARPTQRNHRRPQLARCARRSSSCPGKSPPPGDGRAQLCWVNAGFSDSQLMRDETCKWTLRLLWAKGPMNCW
eukprot:15462759-Alexandrium_andersonii.AAC.1